MVNRKIANTAIGRDVAAALAEFEDFPVLAHGPASARHLRRERRAGACRHEVDAKGEAAREIARLVGHLFTKEEKKVA